MSKHPSAEDEPPMKVKKGDKHTTTATSVCMLGAKGTAQEARPRQKGHGRSDADSSATVAMGATDHECPPAATQARLRAQARPWKSTADAETEGHARSKADSSAAMATGDGFVDGHRPRIAPWIMQKLIDALVSAELCSQGSQGRSQKDWSLATATGHGTELATGPYGNTGNRSQGCGCEARWAGG